MRHAYWISAAMGGRLRCRSRGLTLLELIVVLVILAALGTVMITQTTSLTGEARYQQTVRTLEQLQDAVIGRQPVGGEDPTGIGPGFVSDMGRLPEAVADGTAFTLAELWDRNLFTDADLFAVRNLTGLDNDLQLASGWRGPEDTPAFIEALEGMSFAAGLDFPSGDFFIRPADHRAFRDYFVERIQDGKLTVVERFSRELGLYDPPVDLTGMGL